MKSNFTINPKKERFVESDIPESDNKKPWQEVGRIKDRLALARELKELNEI